MHPVRSSSQCQMQRVPRGLVHVAAELRSLARCTPAAAAWRAGSAQLAASSTHARSCIRATSLASEQRAFLQASPVPLAVSAHEEVSISSAAADGAHIQATPAAVPGAQGPEDQGDAPHTPVLLREVTRHVPLRLTVATYMDELTHTHPRTHAAHSVCKEVTVR